MKRRKKNVKGGSIKQTAFADRNYTRLDSLPSPKGGRIDSPFRKLKSMALSSWYSDFLPNSLWACILSSALDRDSYLKLFRQILAAGHEEIEENRPRVLSHNFLAKTSSEIFDRILRPALSDDPARNALRALLLIDCLPDKEHWMRHLDLPNTVDDGNTLAKAVADNFDHQGEQATDVRWFKVMHEVINGKSKFGEQFSDVLENWRLYPNRGDMKSVRPSIRAFEMTIRNIELLNEAFGELTASSLMGEEFWKEMKKKTDCIIPRGFEPPSHPPVKLRDDIMGIILAIQNHFHDTATTTSTDPRHDGAFGLVLFSASHLLSLAAFYGHDLPYSRTILRSIVEAFITLEFLSHKDDSNLWEQYRRYGAGQTKLAFLKNIREDETPEYFDLNILEQFANEDMWLEFEDINIGNWAKKDLRSMSMEAGVKDVYDRYYDVASGFAHGHWIAVRETAFVTCLNPLHRYHRIPGAPMAILPSVLPDGAKLLNRMLDRLNSLYPTFKPRIKAHKRETTETEHRAQEETVNTETNKDG